MAAARERIVVALDEGDAAQAALQWAVDRAVDRGAELRVVAAVDELMVDRGHDERLETARLLIHRRSPTMPVSVASVEGPLTGIVREESRTADLIVVGHPRSRPVGEAVAGSTAVRVAIASRVPTVIVPDDLIMSSSAGIVAGVPSDDSGAGALVFAAREARAGGCAVDLVHAWGLPPASDTLGLPVADAAVVLARHRRILADAVAGVGADVPVREFLVGDDPADALLSHSETAVLVVVGTHGRGPVIGRLMGSIAQRVVRNSRIPVCVVPPDWRPEA